MISISIQTGGILLPEIGKEVLLHVNGILIIMDLSNTEVKDCFFLSPYNYGPASPSFR